MKIGRLGMISAVYRGRKAINQIKQTMMHSYFKRHKTVKHPSDRILNFWIDQTAHVFTALKGTNFSYLYFVAIDLIQNMPRN